MQSQHRPAPTTLAFHASRIVIDVGVLLAMASLSLDFVEGSRTSQSALQADALPAVILLLPIFLITLIPDHTRPLPRPLGWASLILGLAAFPYAIVKHLDASVMAETLDGSVAIGARLLVFGTFVTLVGITIGLTRSFMGLPTGGNPARRSVTSTTRADKPTVRAKAADTASGTDVAAVGEAQPSVPDQVEAEVRRPERGPSPADENPFEEPLFDSLEIPAFVEPTRESGPSTLVFDAEAASDRVAEEDEPED
ncbi:MAG TPA: hypothetical protein VK960_05585 [Acidimicrobiia bacterium]|nr:hypothetical protein [Acidimicrobiia bacterium]